MTAPSLVDHARSVMRQRLSEARSIDEQARQQGADGEVQSFTWAQFQRVWRESMELQWTAKDWAS